MPSACASIGNAGERARRTAGSARCRSSPQSSSMTWVQPASLYSWIAAMQSSGVPAIGLHLSRISSVTAAFAASRPPASIASATGRISSCVRPAHSSSVSAAPWMFCTLFARYMPAISRAPSRPCSRSSSIEATIGAAEIERVGVAACLLELPADVADERRRRDRRGQQPVGRLRRGAQHHRPGAGEVQGGRPSAEPRRRPSARACARRRPCRRSRARRPRGRRG